MQEPIWLLILLVLSAFFSGSEIALMSIADHRIRFLKEQKRRGSEALAKIRAEKKDLLIAILIGNNVVNIAAAAMATQVALGLFDNNAIAITTGVMTFLILFFGEIIPKAYATTYTETIGLFIAPAYRVILWCMFPIVWVFKLLLKAFKVKSNRHKITEDELKMLVNVGEEDGQINPLEKDLIHRVFRFNDVEAKEIMTPHTKMVRIEADISIDEAFAVLSKHKYSRMPVYDGRIDNIVGILYLKDILDMRGQAKGPRSKIRRAMHKPFFIHETLTIDKLFKQFQRKKIQIAIVVDEHGGVSGMVTMEDILEEIVGEIFDETEKIEHEVKRKDKDRFDLMGTASIEEVNSCLKTSIPDDVSYDTVSGFLQKGIGRIPKEGDGLRVEKWRMTITKMEGNRIEMVKAEKGPIRGKKKPGRQ